MISTQIQQMVENEITEYSTSSLKGFFRNIEPHVIKFVQSKWAANYSISNQLKISETPALTWGTATYVTPLIFPLSSALYGRIGLVSNFDPTGWRIFDATKASAQNAYISWAKVQPIFAELLLTVHSTQANHYLRNKFRKDFKIDCVLFHPDQEAEHHTDPNQHVWMAVTDWANNGAIDSGMSNRFNNARFTVLIDEDFQLQDQGLPIRRAERQIENITERMQRISPQNPFRISNARRDRNLPALIINIYKGVGYLHIFIEP